MTKKQLISMIDEMIFDYEVTGGIMPNTLEKAKALINYYPHKLNPKPKYIEIRCTKNKSKQSCEIYFNIKGGCKNCSNGE